MGSSTRDLAGCSCQLRCNVAGYRETTLTALQQVEENLAELRILEQEARQQQEEAASTLESLQIFNERYIGGADRYLQVLTAQTIALQNERNDVDILRRRMDASVRSQIIRLVIR